MIQAPCNPILIPHPDYLSDHCADGRKVLPAVEGLAVLAKEVLRSFPDLSVLTSYSAKFLRFLELPQKSVDVPALVELRQLEHAGVEARLLTKGSAGNSPIQRTREHMRVCFGPLEDHALLPVDVASAPAGVGCSFASSQLYADLVPFGPAFQNVTGKVFLSPHGALGRIGVPKQESIFGPLGSPFALDAGFHLACAWGQRYRGHITFPVGYGQRRVLTPCLPGEDIWCRVVPTSLSRDELSFDLWFLDSRGKLREAVLGVAMRDVFQGRHLPPPWIVANDDPLRDFRFPGLGGVLLEVDAIAPFATNALSERERRRYLHLGQRRRPGFLGARIALKQLARQIDACESAEAAQLETLNLDETRPRCPITQVSTCFAAAAHDRRFVVAVASNRPIGVDVELLQERVLRIQHFFLSDSELHLVSQSKLGEIAAAIRAWSAKECVAKALNTTLASAWARSEIQEIGTFHCDLTVDQISHRVQILPLDEHVLCVLELEPA